MSVLAFLTAVEYAKQREATLAVSSMIAITLAAALTPSIVGELFGIEAARTRQKDELTLLALSTPGSSHLIASGFRPPLEESC